MRALVPAAALVLALAAWAGAQAPADDPAAVVGPPRAAQLAGTALEARTKDVGALLRCPVCQGLSVADSPSEMAVSMRHQVRDLLAAGYDQEQILQYFERSYGEFVRLRPPLRGVNWIVWLAPALGLLAGACVVGWALRGPRAAAPAEAPASAALDRDALPDDPALHPYVLRIRERAYGWPGGLSPRPPAAPES
ncbi:MAG: cytochrome c-type biogenesis protein [Vicinamibacteria bacterium]